MELFRIYPQIDSTNKEAARLLAGGDYLHGTAILSHKQTEGKGQYGRHWHAHPGLHMSLSIILQPGQMMASELPQLSMKTCLALVRTISQISPHPELKIKWPNDIYADGKKLVGILIENALHSSKVTHSIIGIGMNVNEDDFPPDIPNATSLHLLTGNTFDINDIALRTRDAVMAILDEPVETWKHEYDNFIFGAGAFHSFLENGELFSAEVKGIGPDGKIILDDGRGRSKSYFAHELKWVIT